MNEKEISRELAKKQIEIILKLSPVINSLSELYNQPDKCNKDLIFSLIGQSVDVADEIIMSITKVYSDLDPHISEDKCS